MQVIYFEKEHFSHIYYFQRYSEHCFYIPDKQLILYKKKPMLWDKPTYALTQSVDLLEEARKASQGRPPRIRGVVFSRAKKFDYDAPKLQAIIENAKSNEAISNETISSGIEALLKKVK
jgi:hypothetical protein